MDFATRLEHHNEVLEALARWMEAETDGRSAGYLRAAASLITGALHLPDALPPEEGT